MKVSSSGYYCWCKKPITSHRDEYETELIELIFEDKKMKAGARTVRMILRRNFFLVVNLKKIRRIMKKQSLITVIRKRRRHNYSMPFSDMNTTRPNYLDRNFDVQKKDQVYCTDITYLDYGSSQRAFLSVVKDVGTREIVHYKLAPTMHLNLVTDGLNELFSKISSRNRKALLMHSDQGGHYTSRNYQVILEKFDILQSMSRKGNCLDNAPVESFFGHLKDEVEYKCCLNYKELAAQIKDYIEYYNNERPQWGLNGRTPTECRGSNLGL